MFDRSKKILLVGLGLIGGSYAQALRRQGFFVGAVTRTPDSIEYALEQGMIDCGTTDVTLEFVGQFDLLVFALYPHVMVQWISEYQNFIKKGALLTDVTGVKCAVVYEIQKMLRSDLEFVGAHPMAGRELSGVRNADWRIFQGANYIVTPTAVNTPQAVEAVEELGRLLGAGRISRLSPESHDEMIAFLSQLTHCIAVALMTSRDSTHLAAYSGDSFRDLTRIARINDEMWSELFLLNRDTLLQQIDLFCDRMHTIRTAIHDGDTETLRSLMRLSTERRTKFD